ncbi:hypothetical protein BH10PSE7_BH10PSE7_37910 [soil metagenome]
MSGVADEGITPRFGLANDAGLDPPHLNQSSNLHRLSPAEVAEAVARLTPEETRLAMSARVMPIAWSPGRTLFAIGTDLVDLAQPSASPIVAQAEPAVLLRALQRRNNRALMRQAVSGFATRFPQFSARRHLAPEEVLIAVIIAAAIAVIAYLWPWPTLTAASLVFSIFFLAVIGLRILALLPQPERPPPLRLADCDLPVYSVLVPLLRETGIVDQLVTALTRLDYPAFGSKRRTIPIAVSPDLSDG